MDTLLIYGAVIAVFIAMHVLLIQKYSKTKDRRNLYFGISCFLWAIAAVFGVLLNAMDALGYLSLAMLFNRISITSGVLGFAFINVFAVDMAKSGEKRMRDILTLLIPFLVITFTVWAFDPVPRKVTDGTREFLLTSMYKAPYGLPLVEIILTLMGVMVAYPTYLFFHVAENTKEKIIKIKSFLMGTGFFVGAMTYSVDITVAVPYEFLPTFRPIMFVGCFILFFGHTMPKWIERKLVGHVLVGEESVKSFVEEFFVHPIAPSIRTQPHVFSKTLGLSHQQMVGRKVLLEFDPISNYEKAIHDFVTEALANEEPIIIFTRRGGTIHSSLSELKAVKVFCLTPQVSVPKEFSETEMLLPSGDTSLMLDVFDKTLRAHPQGVINVIFDSLSDLVLSIGFEKTYHFMRYAAEMLTSPRIIALFLVNESAHDPKVVSSLRDLFSNQISFGRGGIQTVKLMKREAGTTEIEKISAKKWA